MDCPQWWFPEQQEPVETTGNLQRRRSKQSRKSKIFNSKKKFLLFSPYIRISVTKEKETPPSGPPSAHVPMPDLTSQPLDPNEPTYCLCQQVSFGEMIGCDNDDVRMMSSLMSIVTSPLPPFSFSPSPLSVSHRVVPFPMCWSDFQAQGKVVLP